MTSLRAFPVVFVIFVAAPACAERLHLICTGSGNAERISGRHAYAYDNRGNTATAEEDERIAVPYADQATIDFNDDGSASIRPPRAILPKLHGGEAGVFRIDNVVRSDSEITGTIKLNVINAPHLHIDRISGHIAIDGRSGTFSGECQAVDLTAAQRRF